MAPPAQPAPVVNFDEDLQKAADAAGESAPPVEDVAEFSEELALEVLAKDIELRTAVAASLTAKIQACVKDKSFPTGPDSLDAQIAKAALKKVAGCDSNDVLKKY